MKKKDYKIIFVMVILFILLIGFCIYEIFKNKTPSIKSIDGANYAFVKSHNIEKRTKVSFPVFYEFKLDEKKSNDFEKEYSNSNGTRLIAIFHKIEGAPSGEFATYKYNIFKSLYNEKDYLVNSSNIKCNHTCQRYQVFKNNKIMLDVIKVFIEFSKEEIFELAYEQEKESISKDVINTIIDNIYITNDANYIYGLPDEEYLRITLNLLNYSRLHIAFDSNIYEEIEDGDNNIHLTTIKNKKDDSIIKLYTLFNYPNKTILESIDNYYKTNSRKEIKIANRVGYEYSIDTKKSYAIILDNESALLLENISGSVKLNDIKKIMIEKDDNE